MRVCERDMSPGLPPIGGCEEQRVRRFGGRAQGPAELGRDKVQLHNSCDAGSNRGSDFRPVCSSVTGAVKRCSTGIGSPSMLQIDKRDETGRRGE